MMRPACTCTCTAARVQAFVLSCDQRLFLRGPAGNRIEAFSSCGIGWYKESDSTVAASRDRLLYNTKGVRIRNIGVKKWEFCLVFFFFVECAIMGILYSCADRLVVNIDIIIFLSLALRANVFWPSGLSKLECRSIAQRSSSAASSTPLAACQHCSVPSGPHIPLDLCSLTDNYAKLTNKRVVIKATSAHSFAQNEQTRSTDN